MKDLTSKNMLNARLNSGDVKELVGQTVKVKEISTFKKNMIDSETGEETEKTVVCFADDNDNVFASPSPTLTECLLAIKDYAIAENIDMIDIKIEYKKSNNKRQFLTASLV